MTTDFPKGLEGLNQPEVTPEYTFELFDIIRKQNAEIAALKKKVELTKDISPK